MKTSTPQPLSLSAAITKTAFKAIQGKLRLTRLLLCIMCFYTLSTAQAQLHGNYTINPAASASATNYKDFRSAVTDLDSGVRYDGGTAAGPGISGATVFKVADGTYTEHLELIPVSGASATSTIKFVSASADNSKVILKYPTLKADYINGDFVDFTLYFDKARYFTFSDMTISRYGSNGYGQVLDFGAAKNITIQNCIIQGGSSSQYLVYTQDLGTDLSDRLNFIKNIFTSGTSLDINQGGNVLFENNFFDKELTNISISSVNGISLKSNTFSKGTKFSKIIISLDNSVIKEISKNIFDNVDVTINQCENNPGSPAIIVNNVAHKSKFLDRDGKYHSYYNNTFDSITSNLGLTVTEGFVFKNNIIKAGNTTTAFIFSADDLNGDFNDYYFINNTYFGSSVASRYTSLTAWKSGTGQDAHSILIDPQFTSLSDFTVNNTGLNTGTPIAGITDDINGNPRNIFRPTIGAYELFHTIDTLIHKDTTICKGSCAYFSSPVSGRKYRWSTHDTTSTTKFCTSATDTLKLTVWIGPGAGDTIRVIFTVHVTAYSCVWPGDANYDGVDDIYDALSVGIAYGDTGAARPSASTAWTPQTCADWTNHFTSGVNHKNADCNGDGVVDSTDAAVISLNNTKTHLKSPGMATGNPSDPPLAINFSKDSVKAGDTVQVSVLLGSDAIAATDVYGIAMKISYKSHDAPTYLKSDFSNSWLGTYKKDMIALVINDAGNNMVDLAMTRIDHKNVTGYGQIAVLSIIMPENLGGKREVKEFVNLQINAYKAIKANENDIPLYPTADSIIVYEYKSGIDNSINNSASIIDFKMYPDPAHDVLNIASAKGQIAGVQITDIMGKTVYDSKTINSSLLSVPTVGFARGIYIIDIKTNGGYVRSRFVKE